MPIPPDHPQIVEESQLREINRIARDFENELRAGGRPTISEVVESTNPSLRDRLLRELVLIELDHRPPESRDKYLAGFPEPLREPAATAFEEFLQQGDAPASDPGDTDASIAAMETLWEIPSGIEAYRQPSQSPDGSATDQKSENEPDRPDQLGRYRIQKRLGRGGMASVYLARDLELDRLVAVKIPEPASDPERDQESGLRFQREARTMATVEHPNLCPVYDVGECEGRPFLAMAYIEGPTLAEWLEDNGACGIEQAVRLVRKLAEAVQVAHDAGIVHRDLKPGNVMINRRGEPVVMDFGLARREQETDDTLTQEGMIVGSPAYMAPEQVEGDLGAIGPRTDVYALGVILYEMLCGQRPYTGSALSVLAQITSGTPLPVRRLRSDVGWKLESVCLRAMAGEPDDRYASAAELAAALAPFTDEPTDPLSRSAVRGTRSTIAAISAIVAAVAAAVFVFRTPTGTVTVAVPDGANDVEVVLTRDGEVTVIGPNEGWNVRIREGTYHVSLRPQPGTGDAEFRIVGDDTLTVIADRQEKITIQSTADVDAAAPDNGAEAPRWKEYFRESLHAIPGEHVAWAAFDDVDRDGDPDLMLAGRQDTSGKLLLNDGNGRFKDSEQSFPAANGVVFGDVDNDGDPDAWLIGREKPERILLNDGQGHLIDSGRIPGLGASFQAVLVDLDGDDDLDAVTANGHSYFSKPGTPMTNEVFFNDGTGVFQRAEHHVGRGFSWDCVALDADADGDADLCIANTGRPGTETKLWINDGSGRFEFGQLVTTFGLTLAAGDVDNDQDIDLVVGRSMQPAQILLNDGTGAFADSGQHLDALACMRVILADLDNDSDPDIVLANRERIDGVGLKPAPNSIWWNDGDGHFTSSLMLNTADTIDLDVADADGDGDLDLLEVTADGQPCRLWLNQLR